MISCTTLWSPSCASAGEIVKSPTQAERPIAKIIRTMWDCPLTSIITAGVPEYNTKNTGRERPRRPGAEAPAPMQLDCPQYW
ncbi:MAG: hypothetical protein AMXMBFR47_33060 [Planctomycetota bacterium]